jgi:hypothetical protein
MQPFHDPLERQKLGDFAFANKMDLILWKLDSQKHGIHHALVIANQNKRFFQICLLGVDQLAGIKQKRKDAQQTPCEAVKWRAA